MSEKAVNCVLLADRHHGLTEGLRGLLATMFETVVMVAETNSLLESAGRLQPQVAVVDLSLDRSGSLYWLHKLRMRCPQLKLIVLSAYDEPSVRVAVMEAGADDVVLISAIGTGLLPAIESALAGGAGDDLRK